VTYATINGWALEAAGLDEGERTVQSFIGADSTYLNRPQRERSGIAKTWEIPVVCQTPADADTLEGLLGGRSFLIPCDDDAWSAGTGIGPAPGSAYTVEHQGAGEARFGRGFLDITSATWDGKLPPGKHAIAYWRGGPGSWEHVIVRSDGAKWLDGVRADATPTPELTIAAPSFTLAAIEVDEIAVYAFLPSDPYLEASAAWTIGGRAFTQLPRLELDGDVIANCPTIVEGRPVDAQSYIGAHYDGEWASDRRDLTLVFDALEVNTLRRIWRPAFGWRLDDKYLIQAGGAYHPFAGTSRAARTGGSDVGGPFGFGGGVLFIVGTDRIDVEIEACRALNGVSRFSVAAWVRRGSTGAQQTLLSFSTASNVTRLLLDFEASDAVRVLLRDGGAATTVRSFSAGSLADTDEYHLIGADVDLIDDVARIYVDGLEVGSGALGVAFATMQGDAGALNRLALNRASGFQLNGDLAWAGLFLDRLPAYAWSELYRLGKRGVFV